MSTHTEQPLGPTPRAAEVGVAQRGAQRRSSDHATSHALDSLARKRQLDEIEQAVRARGLSGPSRGPRHRLAAWWGVAAVGAVCLPAAVACLLVAGPQSVKWISLGSACLAANIAARRWVMTHRSEETTYDGLIDKLMTRYRPVDVTAFQELQSVVRGTGFIAAPFRDWLEAERAAAAGQAVVLRPPERLSDPVYTFTSRSGDDDYGQRSAA